MIVAGQKIPDTMTDKFLYSHFYDYWRIALQDLTPDFARPRSVCTTSFSGIANITETAWNNEKGNKFKLLPPFHKNVISKEYQPMAISNHAQQHWNR